MALFGNGSRKYEETVKDNIKTRLVQRDEEEYTDDRDEAIKELKSRIATLEKQLQDCHKFQQDLIMKLVEKGINSSIPLAPVAPRPSGFAVLDKAANTLSSKEIAKTNQT
jgi:hypothetical protein